MVFDSFDIKSLIRPVIDFPKPGVIFRDITPLFQSPTALRLVMDSFAHRYVEADFTHIGAMDARGFLIGSVLAYQLNKPLVLFRKQGKLPADVRKLLLRGGELCCQGSGSGAIGTLRGPQRYPLCAGACCHWSCSPSTRTMARRARSSSVRPLIHPTFTPYISPIGVSVPWPNTRTPQWRQK